MVSIQKKESVRQVLDAASNALQRGDVAGADQIMAPHLAIRPAIRLC